jgi:transcriptional regulator with XRE-family HTH domain
MKSGLSQEELAERAELHRTYVSDIERGARNPSLRSIDRLAKALKVSYATLFQPLEDSLNGAGASMPKKASSRARNGMETRTA